MTGRAVVTPNFIFPSLRKLWLPSSILIIGLLCAIFVHLQHQNELTKITQQKLDENLELIKVGVSKRINLYSFGLKGLRGAIMSVGVNDFDYLVMQKYIRSRGHETEFPGARGFGVIKNITPEAVETFIETAKLERPDTKFNVKTLSPHNDNLYIIQYLEPEILNQQAIGLDIGSEPMRRQAAVHSALINSPILTAPITLAQANQKSQHGFLILLAFYADGRVPDSAELRMSQLRGWVVAPVLIDEVLSSLPGLSDNVELKISDITEENAPAFFTYGSEIKESVQQSETSIQLLGRNWHLQLIAEQSYLDNMQLPEVNETFFAIIIITLAIVLIIYIMQLVIQHRNHLVDAALFQESILKQANQSLELKVSQRTAELTRLSSLQESILDSASYSIIATTDKGIVTVFNPAAEELLGYKASEVIGKASAEIFHVEEEVITRANELTQELGTKVLPGFDTLITKASLGRTELNRWTYVTKSGDKVQVNLSVSVLTDGDNNKVGYLGVAYDLTEQLKHQKVLASAKEVAENANKAKSEFLANMSHEIRTPMNGLFGTLQLLQQQTFNDEGQNLLNKAMYSTKSLTTIINDILDFSKIEAGKFNLEIIPFKLSEQIANITSSLAIDAENKNITLNFSIDSQHDYWLGDPVRIQQILLNIISNAIKFTKEGGVTLDVSHKDDFDGLVFTVTDSGIGMSDDALARLFNRFEQADNSTTRKYGGTGLGLSICDSLIKLMNGKIKVQSSEGAGSTFIIYIPATQTDITNINKPTVHNGVLNLAGKRILIAEDNSINQLVVVSMLKPTNATIDVVDNGQKAIDYCLSCTPDIILMDIHMPEVDGVEACTEIKNNNPNQKIIALTANVFTEERVQYERLFDGYLAKPVEKSELYGMLSSHLAN